MRTEAAEGVGAGQNSKSLCAQWTDTHLASRASTATSVHLLCTYCVSKGMAIDKVSALGGGILSGRA